ncbi:MAG: response regulator [Planctomycetia bacterium]|nr:response regulator [Planctomycetia bacterium]
MPDSVRPLDTTGRILVVAPTKRDGDVSCALLAKAGVGCLVCRDLDHAAREIGRGADALLLTGDALASLEFGQVLTILANQPAWSDLAVVVLLQPSPLSRRAQRALDALSNVTLLERPAPVRSVVSAVQTAIRGRERQYQIRDQIESIRRAEEAANELRRQLEGAINASEVGTFHCEMPLGKIIWNERCKRMFWLDPDAEVDIELFYSILHPDDREPTRQAVEACVYAGRPYDIEYRTVSHTGDFRWIRATGRTTYDEHGKPLQFDGTAHDITSRKLAEEALKDADRRKDEFLATLAHELRNPLAPIRNSLHLLRLSGDLSPALTQVRDIMERQVNHMVRLIDDLLDVSRISRGKIELRKESVELATIVATAVEANRPLIEAARHQLALALPPEPIFLDADPVRLAQIIGNLLNNAAKYTPPGGQIWFTAQIDGSEAVLLVRDNGLGISPEMLPRVFDMFAQLDSSISRSQGGLGIGLTLTKTFVEMHGGHIEARSDGPGQGSEFVVRLPLPADGRQRPLAEVPVSSSSPVLPSRRVLIVDDAPSAGYVLGKLLEKMGQRVTTANDALTALEIARQEKPEIVISDIGMPNIDGYQLAQRLRHEPGLEKIPLVALTGYGQESDKERAKNAGFDYHLVKPVSLETLQDLLTVLTTSRKDRG